MSMNNYIRRGHPIIFGLLILFSVIELSISAWLTARFHEHHNYSFVAERDRTAFVVFMCCWSIIFGALYAVGFQMLPDSAIVSVLSHGAFLLLTWLLWTAAVGSVTAMLGGGLNCATQSKFVYCGQLNAMEAFAWIIWIIVSLSLIMVIVRGIFAARAGDGVHASLATV